MPTKKKPKQTNSVTVIFSHHYSAVCSTSLSRDCGQRTHKISSTIYSSTDVKDNKCNRNK